MRPVALVTGGARGIGAALVEELSTTFEVAFTHHTSLPPPQAPGLALQADLTQPEAPNQVIAQVLDRLGRLDLLVNNAGLMIETSPGETDLSAHRALFEVNLFAPMALLAAALPHLEPGAAVVNISSINARLPALSAPVYSTTKAALDCWTRAMAKNLGPRGIRMNAVAPGAVERADAPRPADLRARFEADTALGQLATAQDIARAVAFLASPAAAAITGETLTVSGGYRL